MYNILPVTHYLQYFPLYNQISFHLRIPCGDKKNGAWNFFLLIFFLQLFFFNSVVFKAIGRWLVLKERL